MNPKNILVPYDGSSHSTSAFDAALDIAEKFDSQIIILACIEMFSVGWFGKSDVEQIILQKLRAKIMNDIQKMEHKAKKRNVRTRGRIVKAVSVTRQIMKFADSNKIDLIVLGSHGRGGLDRIFLGSVSNGVLQRAKCPVLVVK